MTAMERALLMDLLDNKEAGCKFVFTGTKGSPIPYGHIYRQFGIAQNNANIKNKIRFHDLRHAFASNCYDEWGKCF